MNSNPTLNIVVMDHEIEKYFDVFKLVLLRCNKFSLLPEIFDIFGEKYTAKFLDIFAGQKIVVPSKQDLEMAVRDVDIYVRLKKRPSMEVALELSRKYDIAPEQCQDIYQSVSKLVSEVGGDGFA